MKIGDKIKCVKLDFGLILNKEYRVFSYEPTWCGNDTPVITVEKYGPPYYADCFILSKTNTNMKIGQKIKCRSTIDSNSLIFNAEYIVNDENGHGNIQVKENFGDRKVLAHYYKPERFDLVADAKKAPKTIDLSKKYKTRDGREVKLFAISEDKNFPVLGQVFDEIWYNETWDLNGSSFVSDEENSADLVEVIEEIVLNFPDVNTSLQIRKNLDVIVFDNYGKQHAKLRGKVMDGLIEAYNRMKQCNS